MTFVCLGSSCIVLSGTASEVDVDSVIVKLLLEASMVVCLLTKTSNSRQSLDCFTEQEESRTVFFS